PEFHVPLGIGRRRRLAVPHSLVVGEIVADQVAFLGSHSPSWLLFQLALFRLAWSGFGEEEAVIRCNDDVVTVEVVDDISDQIGPFVDRRPYYLEGLLFRRG